MDTQITDETFDTFGGLDDLELVFSNLEGQPSSFAARFIQALDRTCQNLDTRYLATFLFNEPYVASMDLIPFLRGLDTLFWCSREEGASQMESRAIWCGHCQSGVGGIGYSDPSIPEEMEVEFAFIFLEEEGRLKEVSECRAACSPGRHRMMIPF